ncbi:MAG TPA: patatin-like phospholipase family protein [Flavobacteriales bacterium]|nr:patatin-like phospholipase family protein [Flavobacteriales bacterium]HMR26805.1 patatin-like phospholipase family protein [Flavobacteriales bacterium]
MVHLYRVAQRNTRHWLRRVVYFFPLQLLVLHLKKNHLLLFFWLVLWAYITGNLGQKYGIPYLFLYPEYMGAVNPWGFLLNGFALGGFITAFNLYSYTMHAYRFPFIATLSRPFLKFNINNAVIPVAFTLTYLWCSARLQLTKELVPPVDVSLHLLAFLTGLFLFQLISLAYFTRTNTDIVKMTGLRPEEYRPEEHPADPPGPMPPIPPMRTEQRRATRWLRREQRTRKWHVETYLVPPLRIALARSSRHYDKDLLRSVLWQNHINGSIFEVIVIISFVALGAFAGVRFFEIPTGASAFLLFTMLLMVLSALYSWFKGWTLTVVAGAVVVVNLISLRTEAFLYDSQAHGLDYLAPPAPYGRDELARLAYDTEAVERDRATMEGILDRWHAKNRALTGDSLPPLVIVSTSGGGLRSMLWTYLCMREIDSLLDGTLMTRTALITGSSGGAIGAAYYRQVARNAEEGGPSVRDPGHVDNMSTDILNPVAFTLVTNDMFIRYQRVSDGTRLYTRDRGFVFEQRLNENTGGVLDVRLDQMAEDEREARMPLFMVAPTCINDGRRLLISAQPAAHLTSNAPSPTLQYRPEPEAVEFRRLFAAQSAGDLKLTSALRMSATFPYITPVVTLPSDPPLRVMDAGIRDNYGFRTVGSFLREHRSWIARHTRGVVIMQMRDKQKELEVREVSASLLGRLLDPARNVYGNFVRVQDQDYDQLMQELSTWSAVPVRVVDLQLRHDEREEISLSWHLTAVEKMQVQRALQSGENQAGFTGILQALQLPANAMELTEVPPPGRR